jgi:ribosome-associated heat shock protein Hsp15
MEGWRLSSKQGDTLRLDKWLWFTRLAKSREAAASLCESRRVRLGSRVVDRAHLAVRPGDVISLPRGQDVLAVRVTALPPRRLGAPEAQLCYALLWSQRMDPQPIEAHSQSRYGAALNQPSDMGA